MSIACKLDVMIQYAIVEEDEQHSSVNEEYEEEYQNDSGVIILQLSLSPEETRNCFVKTMTIELKQ